MEGVILVFFFFKQKTAYEIEYGLVGSEMCIRDRADAGGEVVRAEAGGVPRADDAEGEGAQHREEAADCLLYTSDAADERSSVDLGGRRIIKKKNRAGHRVEPARTLDVQMKTDGGGAQISTRRKNRA